MIDSPRFLRDPFAPDPATPAYDDWVGEILTRLRHQLDGLDLLIETETDPARRRLMLRVQSDVDHAIARFRDAADAGRADPAIRVDVVRCGYEECLRTPKRIRAVVAVTLGMGEDGEAAA